ncbi:MAG: lipoyl synthase [Prolixibacteraceae bacterium]|jgi:lipoic acid synthetase|nr:lipoyl synthase [Prolixibacteraceae bacterium]
MNERLDRKPDWLKIKLPKGTNFKQVKNIVNRYHLHTICTSGKCPNMGECWAAGTATLMILGDVCTRSCKFCATQTGKPLPPDEAEPSNVAESIRLMGLKHAVLTSVDRDDLPDKGSGHWAKTLDEIKRVNPSVTIEVLIPDFDGDSELVQKVIDANPDIISHNLETVRRLTPQVRSRAKYKVSLNVLRIIATSGIVPKSGIMLGLGETRDEILETMDDLFEVGCQVLTLGQYLQPTKMNLPVQEYVHPDVFEEYRKIGLEKGFRFVESAPLVRSSYHAEKHVE